MKKKHILFFSIPFLLSVLLFSQKNISPKDLPEKHRKWLEEDVVYVITDAEKDVF